MANIAGVHVGDGHKGGKHRMEQWPNLSIKGEWKGRARKEMNQNAGQTLANKGSGQTKGASNAAQNANPTGSGLKWKLETKKKH